MIQVQPFANLGRFRNDWLNARFHFSFGDYRDPTRMGAGALRVWNDDEIAAGTGFDPHPHRDMEIVTYVREGAITHKDSLGNEGRTEAGDVQVMHAGTGIVHAEYNKETTATRLFQIWIIPGKRGAQPGWGTRQFPRQGGGLVALADGRDVADGSALPLNADAAVLAATLEKGQSVTHALPPGRVAYLVPSTGSVTVNGTKVNTRDGATITGEDILTITADETAEVVLVDVLG
ncbi:MAG: pirin family protein [Alphaproteobacteria bacterium]|jgi:redox-sensitive bicupin YhaK (pirin superfamily)|nr:pirin family protein [Alphaproteobacteria bacterium]